MPLGSASGVRADEKLTAFVQLESAIRRGQVQAEINLMADRSNFWKMVDATKPSKLRVFGEKELWDCQGYFLEIQCDGFQRRRIRPTTIAILCSA